MDAVRRVAHQSEPRIGDARGMMETERIGGARRGRAQLAEHAAHPLLRLGQEGTIGQRHHRRPVALVHRPYDRRAMTVRIVGHRQQGERPGGIEDLVRDIVVRLFVAERRDRGGVVIAPARDIDPGRGARRRIAPFGAHQQRCRRRPAIGKRDANAGRIALDLGGARLHQQGDARRCLGRRVQRLTQQAILIHHAERIGIGGAVERQHARGQPVAHPDRLDRAALPG